MNTNRFRLAFAALVLPFAAWFTVSALAPAQDPKPAPAPEERGEPRDGQRPGPRGEGRRGRGEGPSLHDAMERMETEMKRAQESIADAAKNDVTLPALGRLIQYAGASQGGKPKNLEQIPVEKRAAHELAFRRTLVVLARDVAEVELLVIDGKNAEAAAMFQAKVVASRDSGHEKFGGDDH